MSGLSEMLKVVEMRLRRYGVRTDRIDDLLQDAVVRLLHYEQRNTVENREAFLYRTARNLLTDHARHRQVAATDAVDDSILQQIADMRPSPAAVSEAKARLRYLEKGLAELSPKVRHILLLRRIEGLTVTEIAEQEGLSVAAVEKRIARGTLHLLRWMETW